MGPPTNVDGETGPYFHPATSFSRFNGAADKRRRRGSVGFVVDRDVV